MKLEPWPTGKPLPATCKVEDVLRFLQISRRQFTRLMAKGALPLVEIAKLDRHRRFTGESVQLCRRSRFTPLRRRA